MLELLAKLHALLIIPALVEGDLHCRREDSIPPDLLARIREHQADIVRRPQCKGTDGANAAALPEYGEGEPGEAMYGVIVPFGNS